MMNAVPNPTSQSGRGGSIGGPGSASPGWYANPDGTPGYRWWDGTRWTDALAHGSAPAAPGPPPYEAPPYPVGLSLPGPSGPVAPPPAPQVLPTAGFAGERGVVKTNGLAVASLVCSLVGVPLLLFVIPAALGVVFGFVGRSQIRRSKGTQKGLGLAMAGIIIGFVFGLIGVVALIGTSIGSGGS